ncbi:dual specificity protein phosphatase 4-like [Terrapene carolina triunguis]|uniref:dual specificity protein phosphatase 4-like n=1 Tax=Terrapene triunguis TaxID=2587831 RepID=UPI000CEFE1FD|nr:dual specificity protein phosphatase 4-like [Terrapene carolina triunguis]
MGELREVEGSVLRRLLRREPDGPGPGRCLLLDCRPFLAHSAGYIRGALNVRCNSIVWHRAKGAVSLEQILPAEAEVRARLRSGLYSAVVVYDERTSPNTTSPNNISCADKSTLRSE